jgi:hypothetical protein
MMGVGHVPDVPFPLQAVSDACNSIHVHWGKQYTLAFPVHMYRLLRKEKVKKNEVHFGGACCRVAMVVTTFLLCPQAERHQC